jgi:putative GTP pyrophosphokinase
MVSISKTQIDRLGDRLRKGPAVKDDLILLDSYRRSFREAYEMVVHAIRDRLKLEPSGRSAKSTNSIIEKLKRESIRLTQIQDIAGCRVLVTDSIAQEQVVGRLVGLFPGASIVDRRKKPSYGYRAVHVVVANYSRLVELQVRTRFQHMWAEISEKYADLLGSEIKYEVGEDYEHGYERYQLEVLSETIAKYESFELHYVNLKDSERQKVVEEAKEKLLEWLREENNLISNEY